MREGDAERGEHGVFTRESSRSGRSLIQPVAWPATSISPRGEAGQRNKAEDKGNAGQANVAAAPGGQGARCGVHSTPGRERECCCR